MKICSIQNFAYKDGKKYTNEISQAQINFDLLCDVAILLNLA